MTTKMLLILFCMIIPFSLSLDVSAENPKAEGPSRAAPAPSPTPPVGGYKVGDAVLAFWGQSWWDARIIKVENGKYCVKWEGYDDSWNECGLGPERLKNK